MIDHALLQLDLTRSRTSIDRLERLHGAIEEEIRSISKYVDSLQNYEDGQVDSIIDNECEQVEQLLGMAFVAAQTYLTTVRTAMAEMSKFLREKTGSPLAFAIEANAYDTFDYGNPIEPLSGRTHVRVVNAAANYWKHQDEWTISLVKTGQGWERRWDIPKKQNEAITIVSSIGMNPSNSGNMRTAAETLGVSDFQSLSPIRNTLKAWARHLVEQVENEAQKISSE